MSEPTRYNVNCGDDGYNVVYSLGGEWVRYGDYAKLRKERIHDLNQLGGLQEENARLKAEVERLKAELADEKSANASVEGRLNSANRGLSMRNHLLQAEVERLKAEKDQAECDHDNCQKRKVSIDNHRLDLFTENKTLQAEVERLRNLGIKLDGYVDLLQAENERLRKAGDEMLPFIIKPPHAKGSHSVILAWLAAKEGKQP